MSDNEPEDISVSESSLERMKAELEELKTKGRAEASEALKAARAHGDIRENAEYDAAKQAQGLMEARIRKLEHVIANAVVMQSGDETTVRPGVIVEVKDDGDTDSYYVAASDEDRIDGVRTVTTSSPMGKALVGRSVGDTVEVDAPAGTFSVEVVGIREA